MQQQRALKAALHKREEQEEQSHSQSRKQNNTTARPIEMSHNWNIELAPAAQLVRWNDLMGTKDKEGDDTWLTNDDIQLNKHIPGIAVQYAAEERAGLALYVTGVPHNVTPAAFRDMFMPFGKVNRSPTVISLTSKHTFRWVIMKHADDAEDAMNAMHGSIHESNALLCLCKAWMPGQTAVLLGKDVVGREIQQEPSDDQSTVHGHPSPVGPTPAKLLLPPVPRVAVPAIALPIPQEHQHSTARAGSSKSQSFSSESSGATLVPEAPTAALVTSAAPAQSSWANIASSSDPETRIIDLHPEHRSAHTGPRLNPVGRIPMVVNTREEPHAEQMRLIFLLNLPHNIGLSDVSNAIQEGPLVRIQFGYDQEENTRFAGVIFQYARDAEAFYDVLMKERQHSRPDRFRFIVDVVKGDPLAADETIKAMSVHPFATRRLTIVKGKFFFMFGERQLKDLCARIAGEDNVQLVWLYNGGNATVVFGDVASAIKVKKALDKKASMTRDQQGNESAVWKGLQTTFSKDPCIHPLDLKTAMHD